MTGSIGGPVRYDLLAQQHRPTDQAALATEVRRLAAEQHLTAGDIAMALRLNLAQVREILAASPDEAVALHAAAWRT